jgi:hypothetical protein
MERSAKEPETPEILHAIISSFCRFFLKIRSFNRYFEVKKCVKNLGTGESV